MSCPMCSDGSHQLGLEHLPTDVLVLVAALISRTDAAYLGIACKALNCKLPQQLQRDVHGRRVLLKQSKLFLRQLPAIQELRNFLRKQNELFSLYPPQQDLLRLAFGPVGKRQTDFSQIMNQQLNGTELALTGMLTFWAEVTCRTVSIQ